MATRWERPLPCDALKAPRFNHIAVSISMEFGESRKKLVSVTRANFSEQALNPHLGFRRSDAQASSDRVLCRSLTKQRR